MKFHSYALRLTVLHVRLHSVVLEILSGKDTKGQTLLDKNGKVNFQVGSNANDTTSVDLSSGFTVEQMNGAAKAGANLIADADNRGKSFGVSTAWHCSGYFSCNRQVYCIC